ncbi:MAG: glutamate--tRNA ligase [Acidobacteria bacterium]|nr:glutamate--tRNA ligase [Acidobacteriota bacterium]
MSTSRYNRGFLSGFDMSVRVRFAPSPTGHLHIGGARTALFNWLLARKEGGTFILRIEDTDVKRSSPEMVEDILEGLQWLGLDWDEEPYYQSQRFEIYRSIAGQLLETEGAYRCFCSPELLESKKQRARAEELEWRYDRSCRELSEEEIQEHLKAEDPFVVRFKVPHKQKVHFEDLVYGPIDVETENIEDFVLLRSDTTPTYHLCVVADDTQMNISHVVRGADHLPNTSKHVLLYQALDEPVPFYVHLPLILGPDKKRLSKRHGATSVLEYKKQGFLPAALKNYLVRLGWSPSDDQEIFTEEDLIARFDIGRINKANALFDPQKLEWMNGQYVSTATPEELAPEVKSLLKEEKLWDEAWEDKGRDYFLGILELLKSRAKKLTDFVDMGRPFFSDEFEYEPKAIRKNLSFEDPAEAANLVAALEELSGAYRKLEVFNLENIEKILREVGERHSLKAGKFMGAIRVALTGSTASPGLFDVIVTLGKDKTLERLGKVPSLLQ